MCNVLRGVVVRDAWCVVVRFHALLRPLNCGPCANYQEFSMVLAVHTVFRLIHIYVMTTQPSALVPSYHVLLS